MADHRVPKTVGDERRTQVAFVEYLRECLLAKLDGLSEADARHAAVPSGTNLLWLVKHMAGVEAFWLHHCFAADPEERIPDDENLTHDTVASTLQLYRDIGARTAQIVAEHADLGAVGAFAPFGGPAMSLRWTLAHLIEESGRHAGHADILRELIDGSVGR